ncbi:MAG: UDP-N-acetylmuramoyl-tripeptide--D-alanyl-D-alanine ligase [Flavobacteriaceae bacterium]|nr:UDP-N-acetylmuramoyl-tripeptide--D-alanyl-D-alanine ligase [Flavobacteriaceae bacterium]
MNIAPLYTSFLNATKVCTNTRKLEQGDLFFALSGPNFDGNKFAQQALNMGASAVVIDQLNLDLESENVFVVKNSLETLQALATYHRQKLNTPLIALTGSNGKTTTKELIREILAAKYKVLATEGNLNNHIGVPLTLLKLKPHHQIGIIEMGANHPGEIAQLSEITKPNWGYVTNFGKAHLEGFGSLQGVIQSKSELYKYLISQKQNILINGDDLEQVKQTQGHKITRFGHTQEADFHWEILNTDEEGVRIQFQGNSYPSKLYGAYNRSNIAAALSFGALFNVSVEAAQKALYNYVSKNNRSQKIKIHQTEYILDAYNANPTSMLAALEAFNQEKKLKKVVVLGDMMELGSTSAIEHQNILDHCLGLSIERIITIGKQFYASSNPNEKIDKYETLSAFMESFELVNWEFDQVLIKGSRALELEKLISFFKSQQN